MTRPEIDRGQAWDDAVAKASAFVAGKTSGTSRRGQGHRTADTGQTATADEGFAAEG